jgi:hypothetical protein
MAISLLLNGEKFVFHYSKFLTITPDYQFMSYSKSVHPQGSFSLFDALPFKVSYHFQSGSK